MDKSSYAAYDQVEKLRRELKADKTTIEIRDLGAGSSMDSSSRRMIASIARNAAKPAKYGQLLFRIVKYYHPVDCIELGTSLGLTTSYLAMANAQGQVITMEGAPEVAAIARNNFHKLGLSNIEVIEGDFNATLRPLLSHLPAVGFAFIDGNHRKAPTIDYFNSIVSKIDNVSIVVLDDIHWSAEMEEAWNYCKSHAAVTLSIDLFFIGLLIFKKEIIEKQHFEIRF
jgi:predicted O-methyltransferase YrrM